jgi:hypothetical protein
MLLRDMPGKNTIGSYISYENRLDRAPLFLPISISGAPRAAVCSHAEFQMEQAQQAAWGVSSPAAHRHSQLSLERTNTSPDVERMRPQSDEIDDIRMNISAAREEQGACSISGFATCKALDG